MDVYKKLEELKITLPNPPSKGGVYSQVVFFGDKFCYCSGCGPILDDETKNINLIGKLGDNLSIEDGQRASYNCMLNILAVLNRELGDLNKIKKFVKILAFVNSTDDFSEQPKIINEASNLLISIFGEEIGLSARSAIGTNSLPGKISCEIEVLLEIK
ncbi:RidA family protein [Brachyspira alvinipulli]|uniref:RidA family protein n=1 Tax=Brachyspira alvinipulli TaxID=84379 RepID=UPI00048166E7|nr:RidA family protein [Brachyspira alvinipulli]